METIFCDLYPTTDSPKVAWRLKEQEVKFWREFSVQDIYSPQFIANNLKNTLLNQKYNLPDNISRERIDSQGMILDIPLKKMAKKLSSPEEVSFFVQILCEIKIEEKNDVWEAVNLAKDKERFIKRQYSRLSNREDQLLALGLCFFDGLFETQFFLALEKVIDQSWGGNFPTVGILDYCHMNNLHSFFETDEIKTTQRKFKSRFLNQSQFLLKIAWDTHRRHILVALPVLSQIVKESVLQEFNNKELYRNKSQRKQLRTTISNAISYIGLKSINPVEEILLELASGPNPNGNAHHFYRASMQAVAANAIAQWYEEDEKQLFDILLRWQNRKWKKTNLEINQTGVELTVARAVNYIIRDYSPEKLPPELRSLLCGLFKSRKKDVTEFFDEYIQGKIFPHYLGQLDNILFEMAKNTKKHKTLFNILTQSKQPKIVADILKSWYDNLNLIQTNAGASEEVDRSWKRVLSVIITASFKVENVFEKNDNYFELVINIVQSEFDLFFGEGSPLTIEIKLAIANMVNQSITHNILNAVPFNLYDLVHKLYSHSRDPQLHRFFEESIFPAIFPRYLVQFSDILLDKAKQDEWSNKVVERLVDYHGKQRQEVFKILDFWREKWQLSLKYNDKQDLVLWGSVLKVVGQTYEKINSFNTIELWLLDFVNQTNQAYASNGSTKKAKLPEEITGVVAIIAKGAIQKNLSNPLSENMKRFLRVFAKHHDTNCQQLFYSELVPQIFPRYLAQLRDLFFQIAQNLKNNKTVVKILVEAYPVQEELILETLDLWRKEWRLHLKNTQRANLISLRNTLITFVLIHDRLNKFYEVRLLLFEFFAKAEEQQRAQMAIDTFTNIYISQRHSQINSDEDTTSKKDADVASPKLQYGETAIEQEMIRWLRLENNKDYARMALQVLIGFSRELEIEAARTDGIKAPQHDDQASFNINLSFLVHLARSVKLLLDGNKSKNIMLVSEALHQYKLYPFTTKITLEKWDLSNNSELNDLAFILKNAILLHEKITNFMAL